MSVRTYVRDEVAVPAAGLADLGQEPRRRFEAFVVAVAPSAVVESVEIFPPAPLRTPLGRKPALAFLCEDVAVDAAAVVYDYAGLQLAQTFHRHAVCPHSVEPEHVDFPVARQKLLDLRATVFAMRRDEFGSSLLFRARLPVAIERRHVGVAGKTHVVAFQTPVRRRIVKTNFHVLPAAGGHELSDEVASPEAVLRREIADGTRPEAESVVVLRREDRILETGLLRRAENLVRIELRRVEPFDLPPVFVWRNVPRRGRQAPSFEILRHLALARLDHSPREVTPASYGRQPPVDEKPHARLRIPLRVGMSVALEMLGILGCETVILYVLVLECDFGIKFFLSRRRGTRSLRHRGRYALRHRQRESDHCRFVHCINLFLLKF